MIELKELSLKRGAFKLSQISFYIKKGEIYLLLGDSGSGKTTTLELVAGFLKPDTGKIMIEDIDITNLPPNKRNIAYLPQKMSLFPHLSIEENILYGTKVRGITAEKDYYKMLVSRFGIEEILNSYPDAISGGQAQRAALARAMIVKPKLLLLDEPFSALHPSLRYELEDLLKSIVSEFNLRVLAVSHDIDEALHLANVISFLHKGSIIQTAKRNEIYFRPKTVEVARFFGIKNLFEGYIVASDKENLKIETVFGIIHAKTTHREKKLKPGENIIWGIHSDEVRIIRQEHKKERLNRLSGIVDNLFAHGQYWDLRFLYKDSTLHIKIPDFICERLKIEEKKAMEVELPPERIFIVKRD